MNISNLYQIKPPKPGTISCPASLGSEKLDGAVAAWQHHNSPSHLEILKKEIYTCQYSVIDFLEKGRTLKNLKTKKSKSVAFHNVMVSRLLRPSTLPCHQPLEWTQFSGWLVCRITKGSIGNNDKMIFAFCCIPRLIIDHLGLGHHLYFLSKAPARA